MEQVLSLIDNVPSGVFASLAAGTMTYLGIMQKLVLDPARDRILFGLFSVNAYLERLNDFE